MLHCVILVPSTRSAGNSCCFPNIYSEENARQQAGVGKPFPSKLAQILAQASDDVEADSELHLIARQPVPATEPREDAVACSVFKRSWREVP